MSQRLAFPPNGVLVRRDYGSSQGFVRQFAQGHFGQLVLLGSWAGARSRVHATRSNRRYLHSRMLHSPNSNATRANNVRQPQGTGRSSVRATD